MKYEVRQPSDGVVVVDFPGHDFPDLVSYRQNWAAVASNGDSSMGTGTSVQPEGRPQFPGEDYYSSPRNGS